ncbi:hypothetical protein I6G66_06195 [Delftia acidovorans]|uniref:Uncharacterized protein n=1 Tax=Delftia acidovorans TaxID=80866 RepID=A0A7T2VZW7_DELAC|nr:hypothetical protein [Delftia acidovorans]QPS09611.1 hypothetical protein I6G66_06195 [Delftia acidovorans]
MINRNPNNTISQKELRFLKEQAEVRRLDFEGYAKHDIEMYLQYQRRNCFGLDPSMRIYRIFQKIYYTSDVENGRLTLPRADAVLWGSRLENPLADVSDIDPLTGQDIDYGNLTRNFHALCWTSRPEATQDDWDNFSHGSEAIRIGTTIGKLLDRVMNRHDPSYMNRSWIIDADYRSKSHIEAMKSVNEVKRRMESTGAQFALSAATIETFFRDENEVRFIFDNGIYPQESSQVSEKFISIPFDWNGFVDSIEHPQYR